MRTSGLDRANEEEDRILAGLIVSCRAQMAGPGPGFGLEEGLDEETRVP